MEPCGTPDDTGDQSEEQALTTTCCLLVVRNEQNHLSMEPLGPYSVIISFSSTYYNGYDAGGRVLPLDHY